MHITSALELKQLNRIKLSLIVLFTHATFNCLMSHMIYADFTFCRISLESLRKLIWEFNRVIVIFDNTEVHLCCHWQMCHVADQFFIRISQAQTLFVQQV